MYGCPFAGTGAFDEGSCDQGKHRALLMQQCCGGERSLEARAGSPKLLAHQLDHTGRRTRRKTMQEGELPGDIVDTVSACLSTNKDFLKGVRVLAAVLAKNPDSLSAEDAFALLQQVHAKVTATRTHTTLATFCLASCRRAFAAGEVTRSPSLPSLMSMPSPLPLLSSLCLLLACWASLGRRQDEGALPRPGQAAV